MSELSGHGGTKSLEFVVSANSIADIILANSGVLARNALCRSLGCVRAYWLRQTGDGNDDDRLLATGDSTSKPSPVVLWAIDGVQSLKTASSGSDSTTTYIHHLELPMGLEEITYTSQCLEHRFQISITI